MNFATNTMEREVPMQTQNTMAQIKQARPTAQHRDANPMLSLGLVFGFILLVWGVVLVTSYFESGHPAKSHTAGKTLPPIFIRQ